MAVCQYIYYKKDKKFFKNPLTNDLICGIIRVQMKGGETMPTQDTWSEMSYNKYKNAENLSERLALEEPDVFDIGEEEDIYFE